MKKFDLANWWITLLAIIIIAIVIAILMSGCVAGKMGDLAYLRIGDQKLDDVCIEGYDPNGILKTRIRIGKQEATGQALADIAATARNLSGVVK